MRMAEEAKIVCSASKCWLAEDSRRNFSLWLLGGLSATQRGLSLCASASWDTEGPQAQPAFLPSLSFSLSFPQGILANSHCPRPDRAPDRPA